jgi:hypothetical protein
MWLNAPPGVLTYLQTTIFGSGVALAELAVTIRATPLDITSAPSIARNVAARRAEVRFNMFMIPLVVLLRSVASRQS